MRAGKQHGFYHTLSHDFFSAVVKCPDFWPRTPTDVSNKFREPTSETPPPLLPSTIYTFRYLLCLGELVASWYDLVAGGEVAQAGHLRRHRLLVEALLLDEREPDVVEGCRRHLRTEKCGLQTKTCSILSRNLPRQRHQGPGGTAYQHTSPPCQPICQVYQST